MEGAVAGVLVAALFYVVAYQRKGKVGSVEMTARRIEIASAGAPEAVFAAIAAIGPPYSVDDTVPDKLALVLSSRPSVWSYGFLYPVQIHGAADGCRIVIGVTSRLVHWGPGVGIAHERCANAIRALLSPPTARVTS